MGIRSSTLPPRIGLVSSSRSHERKLRRRASSPRLEAMIAVDRPPPPPKIKATTGSFVLLALGVFVVFLINGIINEAIFQIPGFGRFGWFLTFVQFVIYSCLSAFHLRISGKPGLGISCSSSLIYLSIVNVVAMGLTNASVGYMNYPTQLMFKSCKVISVMATGILLRGTRYRWIDFFAVFLMTVGLVLFTLADATVSPMYQTKGVIMVIGAVVMDGIVGVVQEDLTQRRGIGLTEMVFKIYSIGAALLFVLISITGEFQEASVFCLENWSSTIPLIGAFAITGYVGVLLILALIEKFGALSAVIVTTSRKAITIAISFVLYNKPFTDQYIWSGILILLGIYLNAQKTHFHRWLPMVARGQRRWSRIFARCCCWTRISDGGNEWIV